MNEEAAAFWGRAQVTLRTAESLIESDPDSAASRAYYVALNAVSALFALEGKTFSSHGGVEGAVHRDLVRTKRYPDIGTRYSSLSDLRSTADYGAHMHVDEADAKSAVDDARAICEMLEPEIVRRLSQDDAPR